MLSFDLARFAVLFEILHQYYGENSSLAWPDSLKLAMLAGSEYLEGEARSGALEGRRYASRMYRMQGRTWPPRSKPPLRRSANTAGLSIRVFSSVSITTSKEAVPRLLALIHSAIKLSNFFRALDVETPVLLHRYVLRRAELTVGFLNSNMLYYLFSL